MEQTELKAYAEAEALEKYPVLTKGDVHPMFHDKMDLSLNAGRKAYAQAIIDTYEELERVNEELLEALRKFTILNTDHYKDIAGFIESAREAIQTASLQLENEKSAAVEFTEWLLFSGYESYDYRWKKKWDFISNSHTSDQLYELFKQSKTK